MTKYELEQFLKAKHTKAEALQLLQTLSSEASKAYEQAMEREDIYAIGFTSASHLAYETAIELIKGLETGGNL